MLLLTVFALRLTLSLVRHDMSQHLGERWVRKLDRSQQFTCCLP